MTMLLSKYWAAIISYFFLFVLHYFIFIYKFFIYLDLDKHLAFSNLAFPKHIMVDTLKSFFLRASINVENLNIIRYAKHACKSKCINACNTVFTLCKSYNDVKSRITGDTAKSRVRVYEKNGYSHKIIHIYIYDGYNYSR